MSPAASVRAFRALARVGVLVLALACGADGADLVGPPHQPPDRDRVPNSPLNDAAIQTIREVAHPIDGSARDYDALLAAVGDARVVVLGEATHGSEEFQRERARITQRLILEKGFTAVAIEGGWPETERVNDWIRGRTSTAAEQALSAYTGFPAWMWRNPQVRDFVTWLRAHNDARPAAQDVGIYGLDVYSLPQASDRVIEYLTATDPALAERARATYDCFTPYRSDLQRYGTEAAAGRVDCRPGAIAILDAIAGLPATPAADPAARDARFSALRNAQTVVSAEEFHRNLQASGELAWKVRDQRMSEALAALDEHFAAATGALPRVVVWVHNSHTGDARTTAGAESTSDADLPQLTRARLGSAVVRVGLHTYAGTVRAADAWGGRARAFDLRAAVPESFSDAFHRAELGNFMLIMDGPGALRIELRRERRERAIGAVYTPASELQSHYFVSDIANDLDVVIFIDTTRAVAELP